MQVTLEQELASIKFRQRVLKMSESEAKAQLVMLYECVLSMEGYYKALLKSKWGIEDNEPQS